jgi:hypothetical protein
MISKEIVLLVVSLVWGLYSVVIGVIAIAYGYSNDLVWISIISAISGTTGAHVGLSMSSKGISLQTSGSVQNTQVPKQG